MHLHEHYFKMGRNGTDATVCLNSPTPSNFCR
uniref:Uncharacterized protein n=1 Tax=Dulem virus 42 TaxID=3145760 RepID=A0AAU8B7R5_9CAUD